jgi:multiple sugar transport system permease protein
VNLLHFILLGAAAALLVAYLADPRRPRLATSLARWVLLLAAAAAILTPFLWLIAAVFKPAELLMTYLFLPPPETWMEGGLTLENFGRLFTPRMTLHGEVGFGQHLANSLFVASAATIIQMFLCSLGGYALAKHDFRGRPWLLLFMLGTMMVPHMLFLAPLYNLIVQIGFIDTYWALLIPGAANAFGLFLFRQAISGIPDSLIEAARIDGASEFYIYLRVIMPLVRPMTAAFCLIVFMGQWNAFIGPQIFLQSGYKLTLPVILTQYVTQYAEDYGLFLAGTFLAIIPVAILFLALQREFIAGLTSGAVKG